MSPPPTPRTISYISPIYKYYFHYFEAPMALVGTTLILINPTRFLIGTLPSQTLTLHPLIITPPVQMLLTNIAFLYAMIAVLEGVVLTQTRDRGVWLGVLAAILVSDVGHVWSVFEVDRERVWEVGRWSFDECFNYGTLVMGMLLRVGFLSGSGWR